MSERQRDEIGKFTAHFDTVQKLYNVFSASNWGYMLSHIDECMKSPCITLSQVDAVYKTEGVARELVKNQLVSIYSMSTAKEPYNHGAAAMAADVFIAKYGHRCTLYAMMIYFANYLTEYKSSYSQYDVQDILQMFGRKFLPWWNARAARFHGEQEEDTGKLVGKPALIAWFARRILDGETTDDLRKSALYEMGVVSDKEIDEAVKYAQERF